MKSIIILVLIPILLVVSTTLQAQSKIHFRYDDSGNRELRTLVDTIEFTSNTAIAYELDQDEEVTPIETELGDQEVLIYPNPTRGVLRIDMPKLEDSGVTLAIFDLRGNLLVSKDAHEFNNRIDLSSYPSGTYVLILRFANTSREWKIIKK